MLKLTLNSPWFELVAEGKKIYEGRRNTPKISILKIGDIIEFSHHTDKKLLPYRVKVIEILPFATFESALTKLPLEQILPLENITISQGVEIYYKYVSLQTQIQDGVIMLKIVKL